jgi:hypothetical protein
VTAAVDETCTAVVNETEKRVSSIRGRHPNYSIRLAARRKRVGQEKANQHAHDLYLSGILDRGLAGGRHRSIAH